MRLIAIRLAASSVLSCVVLVAVAAGPLPVPPVKPGLWEARMSALDADGHEMPRPEQAAMSRLSPEARARMAEAMKATPRRGCQEVLRPRFDQEQQKSWSRPTVRDPLRHQLRPIARRQSRPTVRRHKS